MSVLYPEPSFWKTIFSSSAPEVAFQSLPLNVEKVGSLPPSLHCSRVQSCSRSHQEASEGWWENLAALSTYSEKHVQEKVCKRKKQSGIGLCFWDFCVQIFIQGQIGLLQKEKWLNRTCICIDTLFQTTEDEEYPLFNLKNSLNLPEASK